MQVPIPLRNPPQVFQLGLNVHGRLPRERYRMPGLWGIHLYHYDGTLEVAGRRFSFRRGDLSITPPDTELVWRFPHHAPHHYALIGFPQRTAHDVVDLPLISPLGSRAAELAASEAFDAAIAAFPIEPRRTTAWCWDLLWRLSPASGTVARGTHAAGVPGVAGTTAGSVHPAMQICLRTIDLELDRSLSLNGLALRTGVSVNHLLRLFREQVGMTVMAYIRQRRAERARHLIEHTALPLVDIAAAVGLDSHQRLNKLVRQAFGKPPRLLRRGATEG